MAKLYSKYQLKSLELKNRIVMAPMCMYSADKDGNPSDFHITHYASRAVGGTGLIIVEATGVESRGRITDRDLGIWKDEHIEGLKKLVESCKQYGAKMAIQLAHAGRKSEVLSEPSIAPSAIAFSERYRVPNEMTKEDIKEVILAFKDAARRAELAGFDAIEIHGAHGYLINEFLSPLTNKRTDEYGGNTTNRSRFLKEVITEIKTVWPDHKPIIVRVSADDYAQDGNNEEIVAEMLNMVQDQGIDLINVSSGGVINVGASVYPGYQIKMAESIKKVTKLPVIAGGLITSSLMAEEILQNDRADLIFLGRELLRNPYWPLHSANELNAEIDWPYQYERSK